MCVQFVVLDECSQMTEPASLLPIARFACEKLVLVGDPKVGQNRAALPRLTLLKSVNLWSAWYPSARHAEAAVRSEMNKFC